MRVRVHMQLLITFLLIAVAVPVVVLPHLLIQSQAPAQEPCASPGAEETCGGEGRGAGMTQVTYRSPPDGGRNTHLKGNAARHRQRRMHKRNIHVLWAACADVAHTPSLET